MLARLASLRMWLLVAMVASAAAGLGGAAVLFSQLEHSHERSDDMTKALEEAHSIAAQIRGGSDANDLAGLQSLLVNDRIVVVRGGRTIFSGPARRGRQFELQASAPFPGGVVHVLDYSGPSSSPTLEFVLIAGGVLLLVIAAAAVTATVVTRAVSTPIRRAIEAAERVSHGEFDARMGGSGPEEFAKLGRAFDQMAARLERADRDQRQFLADVAHEIATPVNTVAGFAVALADGAAQNAEQRAEAKALIENQTERLGNLLADLRELTRLDLAEGAHPRTLALAPFTEALVGGFRRDAEEAGIQLTATARGDDAFTDGRLLEMVGSNLVSNAIRYTPSGGRVHVRLERQRNKLVLSVRDTGVGIAPEHQQRIFERLYRVDSTRDRATGGSGLGLAIAARAARSLGGYIELDSTPGKGSEFRAVVPAQIESRQSRRESPPTADTSQEPENGRTGRREPLEAALSGERFPRSGRDAAL
ncbi:MAG TPA: HAMP domain-containing sensor histidine kinase [Solirubrobacteraceae bacterium]|nr:HAMP domain-containing sensor histidine kinase [Solirubrobacteraceae bacterium]